ncbi:hypothetical protein HDR58_00660 [bacterium]|nr:hypothetical protein [bacterium]
MKTLIELDKLKVTLDKKYYKYVGNAPAVKFLGGNFKIRQDESLLLETSGKINCSPTDYGAITEENVDILLDKLAKNYDLKIDIHALMNFATVCRIDVKKDVNLEFEPYKYISMLQEMLKKHTGRYEITTYESNLGFKNSILIKPIHQKVADSFSIYSKHRELQAHKAQYKEYIAQFDPEFLAQTKNLIRNERRLNSFAAIRKAFRIDRKKGEVTPQEILGSNVDVVTEKLQEFIF